MVGILAQNCFGYDVSKIDTSAAQDAGNMKALGQALTMTCVVPWMICLVLYSLLHCSYAKDLEHIKAGRTETKAPLLQVSDA